MGEIATKLDLPAIPAMSQKAIDQVRAFERDALLQPQVPLPTLQLIHGDMYLRELFLARGTRLTGALIKLETMMIVSGDADIYVDDGTVLHVRGFRSMPASAGRKQLFRALTDVHIVMVFPTKAASAAACEEEFTDEAHMLASRRNPAFNHVVITGE